MSLYWNKFLEEIKQLSWVQSILSPVLGLKEYLFFNN